MRTIRRPGLLLILLAVCVIWYGIGVSPGSDGVSIRTTCATFGYDLVAHQSPGKASPPPVVDWNARAVVAASFVAMLNDRWEDHPVSLAAEGEAALPSEITGYTDHGLQQAISRDGGLGVSQSAMEDAVANPIDVVRQASGTFKFVGNDATVVLNSDGKVVTTWATNSAGWRNAP
ncbi:MAG: hypothetical protein ACRD0Z_04730 [Acidimicrobiales bacterium]